VLIATFACWLAAARAEAPDCGNERSCYFFGMTATTKTDLAKGERTRARILDEALDLASVQGLGGLTIGPLAERLGLSKSGLFAHFQSKEALQVETLDHAATRFRAEVSEPVRAVKDRADRLAVFFERWIDWVDASRLPGSCPILSAAVEFDDVPGAVRDRAAEHLGELLALIVKFVRAANPKADADATAAAVLGLAMSHLTRSRLLGERKARAVTMRAFEALAKG
jgi:AcrR family transcriptional regulator